MKNSIVALTAALLVGACGGSGEDAATDVASNDAVSSAAEEVEAVAAEAEAVVAEAEAVVEETVVAEVEATVEGAADAAVEAAVDQAAEEVTALAEAGTDAVEAVAVEPAAAQEEVPAAAEETSDAAGKVIEVQMLNAHPENPRERMVFYPAVVQVNVGDTVKFVPSDLSHQSNSNDGMIPEGVEGWRGRVNQEVSYTFEEPGIYGYQCIPHYAAGMIGLVIVDGEGKLDNLEAAKEVNHPGLAGRRWPQLWAEAEEAGYLSN
ncbi:MAG: pseudoazurin [Pseudomonadota bacterium]